MVPTLYYKIYSIMLARKLQEEIENKKGIDVKEIGLQRVCTF